MNASLNFSLLCFHFCLNLFSISLVIFQIDADYKLQDMKKLYKELEMKGRGYKKKLDDLQVALLKHMEQYALLYGTIRNLVIFMNKNFNILIFFFVWVTEFRKIWWTQKSFKQPWEMRLLLRIVA